MSRNVKAFVIPAVTLVIGLIVGGALGQRQGWGMGQRFLDTEVGYSLGVHVEVASAIRIGDTDYALQMLDGMIDAAVANAGANPSSPSVRRSLPQAKVYRRVVPGQGPYASAATGALASVPEPERPAARLAKLVAQSAK